MSATAILELKNVHKNFGGVKAINDFSCSLERGKVHGLIGPNGAGKTTIFNNITGIYAPTEGEIVFLGKNIAGKKPHAIAQAGIGRTFQNIRLFSNLSVLDNVIMANIADAKYNLIDAILRTPKYRRVEKQMHDFAMSLLESVGIAHLRDHTAKNLPYGNQRKLEIARALAVRPKLLLLDEPSSGMNKDESLELVDFVAQVKEDFDLTILLIEHHMDVVTGLCDLVTVLNFGKTIATGTPAEIKKNKAVIEAYLGGSHTDAES